MKVEIPGQWKVISFYGPDSQALQHAEEMAELIQAVSKMRRARNSGTDDTAVYDNLVEEVADVLISIEQIKETYGIQDHEIQTMITRKCLRQEARMHDAYRKLHL